ncbi:MAG TPA: hypothetical protein VFO58_19000 [Vicinamibacterales bacterium]|nr:hypothetical protein [Vicinamibacterales bacterium]
MERSRDVILAVVLGSTPALAASTSAPLAVSVTVVRSCSVDATPASQRFASVTLKCSAGAAPGLTAPRFGSQRLRLQTTHFSRSPENEDLQVVTVNF